ncbi:MAG TPA: hypothetical protein VHT52_05575 [Stellaceae bacterium]|nr:hypothetical protein [Stellaceae bacterium]
MGTTCASFHALWRGSVDDAAKAISRAYTKLGYERLKKPPAEGGKQVILLARASERYVSVFDSTNADLDSGELKDAALAVSKLLKTGAVVTSLYDSDSYEFVVFSNGRQVDLLMTDADSYNGPLKHLAGTSRVTQWNRIFGSAATVEQIERAAAPGTAFADDAVTGLCGLIGLPGDRAQRHFSDFAEEGDAALALYFRKKATAAPIPDGQIALRNYFDPHNSRKLLVYPAAWPMPVGQDGILTWLLLSEGAGFRGGTAAIEVSGPEGLAFSTGIVNGAKFHNRQIVGGYELPANTSPEAARAYLDSKRFVPMPVALPVDGASPGAQHYRAEYPNLYVPPITPASTTQIIVVLQLHITASRPGEWDVRVTLHPGSDGEYSCELPRARVAATEQGWLPVVSGLNPKTAYDTADIVEPPLPDSFVDVMVRRYGSHRYTGGSEAEAQAALQHQLSAGREHNYKAWLQDLQRLPQRLSNERGLDYPAVASNVAILDDEGQPTLDRCRAYIEDWLRPLAATGGLIRIRTERQMTEKFHVGKTRKEWPADAVLADKAWGKLFDPANEYQAMIVEFIDAGGEFPIAGMGFNCTMRGRRAAASNREADADAYNTQALALTIAKMHGRETHDAVPGETVHLYNWVINHPGCLARLGTSIGEMTARLDALAAAAAPLQAWHGQAAWIPVFDRAESYESTVYEEMSALNVFRGIHHGLSFGLKDRRLTAQWCRNILRMVAPHLWLCPDLMAPLDRTALERVAMVSETGGSTKLEKRPDCAMDDFETALLPILPIESTRLTIRQPSSPSRFFAP